MESCVNREERRALSKNKKVDKSKPARILWVSNAPWASTGYGTQTAQATTRLKKHGHEVAIAANYGLEANSTSWNSPNGDIKIYPRGHETYSNDIVPVRDQIVEIDVENSNVTVEVDTFIGGSADAGVGYSTSTSY